MRPFRCQVCGEVYLGHTPPDHCPFCGAGGKELLPPENWVEYGRLSLSESDIAFVEKAVALETENAAFYRACAAKAESRIAQSVFRRLSKQELEHAALLRDLVGKRLRRLPVITCPDGGDTEKFAESHRREERAMNFYLEVAGSADEPRLREVMRALFDIESEHLKISSLLR